MLAIILVSSSASAEIVTVPTAAGINITISRNIAAKMQGLISDLIARGYHPKRISCLSFARSHVKHSLHFRGEACDFDQHGWGKTAKLMYNIGDLTRKWRLRNGCSFRDCGHIDSGKEITRFARSHQRIEAIAQPLPEMQDAPTR